MKPALFAAGVVVGWLACFGQGLWGSKLHSMATRSGISLDKRARMDEDDRFDWMPTDCEMGRAK